MNYQLYNFGERLAEYRREAGLSQKKLADKIGVNGSAVGHYEQNKMYPTLTTLCSMAEALEVTVGELVGEECSLDIYSARYNEGYNRGFEFALDSMSERIKELKR